MMGTVVARVATFAYHISRLHTPLRLTPTPPLVWFLEVTVHVAFSLLASRGTTLFPSWEVALPLLFVFVGVWLTFSGIHDGTRLDFDDSHWKMYAIGLYLLRGPLLLPVTALHIGQCQLHARAAIQSFVLGGGLATFSMFLFALWALYTTIVITILYLSVRLDISYIPGRGHAFDARYTNAIEQRAFMLKIILALASGGDGQLLFLLHAVCVVWLVRSVGATAPFYRENSNQMRSLMFAIQGSVSLLAFVLQEVKMTPNGLCILLTCFLGVLVWAYHVPSLRYRHLSIGRDLTTEGSALLRDCNIHTPLDAICAIGMLEDRKGPDCVSDGNAILVAALQQWPKDLDLIIVALAFNIGHKSTSVVAPRLEPNTLDMGNEIVMRCLENHRKEVTIDARGRLSPAYKQGLLEAERYHKIALERMVLFWKYVLAQHGVENLFKISSSLQVAANRADELYRRILERFGPTVHVCRQYGAFCSEVRYDEWKGTRLLLEADYLEKEGGDDGASMASHFTGSRVEAAEEWGSGDMSQTRGPRDQAGKKEEAMDGTMKSGAETTTLGAHTVGEERSSEDSPNDKHRLFMSLHSSLSSSEEDVDVARTTRREAVLMISQMGAVKKLSRNIWVLLLLALLGLYSLGNSFSYSERRFLDYTEQIRAGVRVAECTQDLVNHARLAVQNCTAAMGSVLTLQMLLEKLHESRTLLMREDKIPQEVYTSLYSTDLPVAYGRMPDDDTTRSSPLPGDRSSMMGLLGDILRSGEDLNALFYNNGCATAESRAHVARLGLFIVQNGATVVWDAGNAVAQDWMTVSPWGMLLNHVSMLLRVVITLAVTGVLVWRNILPTITNISHEHFQVGQLLLAVPKNTVLKQIHDASESSDNLITTAWLGSTTQPLEATPTDPITVHPKIDEWDNAPEDFFGSRLEMSVKDVKSRMRRVYFALAGAFCLLLLASAVASIPWSAVNESIFVTANCSSHIRRANMLAGVLMAANTSQEWVAVQKDLGSVLDRLDSLTSDIHYRARKGAPVWFLGIMSTVWRTADRGTLHLQTTFQMERSMNLFRTLVHAPFGFDLMEEIRRALHVLDEPLREELRIALAMEARIAEDYCTFAKSALWLAIGFVGVCVCLSYVFVVRPMTGSILKEAEGDVSILLMIPPTVARDVPLIQRYLKTGIMAREEDLQQVLRNKSVQSENIMTSVHDVIVVITEKGIVTQINAAVKQIFGYDVSEVVGQNVKMLMPREIAAEHDAYLSNYGTTREKKMIGMNREVRGRRRDGTEFPILLIVSEHLTVAGLKFIGIIKEITEAKELQNKWKQAISGTTGGLYNWNLTTNEVWWSPGFLSMLGYNEGDSGTLLSTFFSGIHPDDIVSVNAKCKACIDERVPFEATFRLQRKQGDYIWVQSRGKIVEEENYSGSPIVKFAGYCSDVTHKKDSEEALLQQRELEVSNMAKRRFLANMSHEIRTPLMGVLGMSRMLKNDPELNKRQRHYSDIIHNCSNQLLQIVTDILDFSKLEAGLMQFEEVPLSPHAMFPEVVDFISIDCYDRGIECAVLVSPLIPKTVVGDIKGLRQVLLNLCTNAVKFTQAGFVMVSVSIHAREGDRVELMCRVKDSGPGVPPEAQLTLFKRYDQLDTHEGAGLGLAICKQIVEKLGGSIGVESVPGRGSTFWFTYPCREDPAVSASLEIPTVPPNYSIIFLHSNKDILTELERMLRACGITIACAYNANEVLYQTELRRRGYEEMIPIFIIDEGQNCQNLSWAATKLRTDYPDCRLICVTSIQAQQHYAEDLSVCAAVVTKPLNVVRLLEGVFRAITYQQGQPTSYREGDDGSSAHWGSESSIIKLTTPRGPPYMDDSVQTAAGRSVMPIEPIPALPPHLQTRSPIYGPSSRMPVASVSASVLPHSLFNPFAGGGRSAFTAHPQSGSFTPGGPALGTPVQARRHSVQVPLHVDGNPPLLMPFPSRAEESTRSHGRSGTRSPTSTTTSVRSMARVPATKGCVLVVEDDAVNQLMTTMLLEELHCRHIVAEDGQRALATYAQMWQSIDAILMDCRLPDMDGCEVTGLIRNYEREHCGSRRVPILACTAFTLAEERDRCLQAGMDDFLTKPILDTELRAKLDRWIKGDVTTPVAPASPGWPKADVVDQLRSPALPTVAGALGVATPRSGGASPSAPGTNTPR